MKAADLAAYFAKKIAKPINLDLVTGQNSRRKWTFFSIEPLSVAEETLHVTVNYRYEMLDHGEEIKQGVARYCGEAAIPMRDGDSVESVIHMALAKAYFGEDSDSPRMTRAYKELHFRLDDEVAARPPGP